MILYKKLKDVSKDEWDESQNWCDSKYGHCRDCPFNEIFNCYAGNLYPYEKMKELMSRKLGERKIPVPIERVLGEKSKKWVKEIVYPFQREGEIAIRFIRTRYAFCNVGEYPISMQISFEKDNKTICVACFVYPRKEITEEDFELKLGKKYTLEDLGI